MLLRWVAVTATVCTCKHDGSVVAMNSWTGLGTKQDEERVAGAAVRCCW